ncbi:G1 family glutamic endopeptidase [Pseudonocardia asaccharolytica]|uniref:G1 family glutamic endopeptidase n=1 Tax=Pseudonocardia asaccharolytica TaxID=54010 RepID=UPI001376EE1D|nr:G1 family glutamic endopeptidase [Pseudonocardia asaccharolytica]
MRNKSIWAGRNIGMLLASLIGLASLLLAPAGTGADGAAAEADPGTDSQIRFNQDGGNWSGFVTSGTGFHSVSASWRQPPVTCSSVGNKFAIWVGIDGYGSSTVEQTGVATDCSSGSPSHQAWYEMVPALPVYHDDPVQAGDSMTAGVVRSGRHYTMTITDNTRGWTRSVTAAADAANTSAEIIVEPAAGSLPRFGKITFTDVTVDGNQLSAGTAFAIDATNSGGFETLTSPLSGGRFSVSYLRE